ncbi:hypothetical protein BU26DRAFT_236036 [Trematosphaeria pertusa]|uniref:DUF7607 domain-containing protein n=1 Tax=Trematosphaeria pertusa TaxID=390896 RepID=A0A6A6IU89_9PLEO|nr:uncharacterized protein BU26DRAFT_236036 [Trematosphaeria pertusa]KAF2254111.1 hypothetical protein BU26DRAFT_236036 [Trematosphaeria pertusa]
MPLGDPWLWSVDDLVTQICYSRDLFDATGHGASQLPEPFSLETELRKQQIAGAAFLTRVDADVLQHDLHIPVPDQTSALLAIIEVLRSRSHIYKQNAATAGVRALDIRSNEQGANRSVQGSSEIAVTDASGRKRRKVNQLATIPLPRSEQGLPATSIQNTVSSEGPSNLAGDWDYLNHWRQANDPNEIIDLSEVVEEDDDIVEEVDDDEPDTVENTWTARTGRLDRDEIVSIINERIEYYQAQWQPGKGEDEIPDPITLWEEAEADDRRARLAEANRANAEFFEHRLDKLGDEILRSTWNAVDEVRRVCAGLETTVDLLEQAKWLVSIYELAPDADDRSNGGEGPSQKYVNEGESANFRPSRTTEVIDLGSDSETPEQQEQQEEEDKMFIDIEATTADTMAGPDGSGSAIIGDVNTPEPLVIASVEPDNNVFSRQEDTPTKRQVAHGDNPEIASINTVAHWHWNSLIDKVDRKRIVMKVMHELAATDREMIRTRVKSVKKQNLLMEIPACIDMLLKKEKKMQGVLPRDLPKILTFTKLFLSWWLADNYFTKEATEFRLEELTEALDAGCPDPEIFYDWVCHILDNTFSKEALKSPHAPSQAEIIVISDDEDDAPPAPQSTRNRATPRRQAETVWLK